MWLKSLKQLCCTEPPADAFRFVTKHHNLEIGTEQWNHTYCWAVEARLLKSKNQTSPTAAV